MDQILSDLASRCALVPPSTGERELLYQDPEQGFCILAHVYDSPKCENLFAA